MRTTIAPFAAILALSAPALAQAETPTTGYQASMDCGIASAFLAGVIEQDDPEASNELLNSATVWLAMAYKRFAGSDGDYEAQIDARSDELSAAVGAMSGNEEIVDFFLPILDSCGTLRTVYSAEYDQVSAELAAAG